MTFSKKKTFKKIDNAGYRLAKRKILIWKLRLICDITLGTALIGVLLMVIEVEMDLTGITSPNDPPTFFLKLAISVSTVILLIFLIWYHLTDIKLHVNDNFVDSWLLVVTPRRLIVTCLEIVVCAIHPPPRGFFYVVVEDQQTNGSSKEPQQNYKELEHAVKLRIQGGGVEKANDLDLYLSILMFLRGFLICRTVVLHSKLCTDTSLQSLSAVNRVRFTFSFIFRSMMVVHPVRVLSCLILTVLITASWTMRACDSSHPDMPSSLWLILVTFLTVGYGDLVPQSYCGQIVTVCTGFFGIGCMALVVAVLTQKLEMTTSERYVHNFVTTVQLQNSYKVTAANIVRCAWLEYKARSHGTTRARAKGTGVGGGDTIYYYHQRRLMAAVHCFRQIKQQKRLQNEGNVSLMDICDEQRSAAVTLAKLEGRLSGVEKLAGESLARLDAMQQQLKTVEKLLRAPL